MAAASGKQQLRASILRRPRRRVGRAMTAMHGGGPDKDRRDATRPPAPAAGRLAAGTTRG